MNNKDQREIAINIAFTVLLTVLAVYAAKKFTPNSRFWMITLTATGAFLGFNAGRMVNNEIDKRNG